MMTGTQKHDVVQAINNSMVGVEKVERIEFKLGA